MPQVSHVRGPAPQGAGGLKYKALNPNATDAGGLKWQHALLMERK